MSRFDVAVVGGGAIGGSIAYHLAKRRLRVVLVDRGPVGGQASGVAAGMLAAQEEAAEPGAFFDLCVASRDLFASLVPEVRDASGVDPEWRASGVWRLAADETDRAALVARAEWQRRAGHAAEWREADDVASEFPALRRLHAGGLYFPKDGQVDSLKWLRALVGAAQARGARVVERAEDAALIFEGDRVAGVRVGGEEFRTDHVVAAAGAWTTDLLRPAGVDLPVEPVKGQLLRLEGVPGLSKAPVFTGAGYFAPKADGRLIVGATTERAGFDVTPTLHAQQTLAELAVRWCPSLGSRQVYGLAVGLRPATPDRLPAMGPVPSRPGLSVCTGHFRNGVMLSAWSGLAMADGVAEGRWDARLAAFRPDRFAAAGERRA